MLNSQFSSEEPVRVVFVGAVYDRARFLESTKYARSQTAPTAIMTASKETFMRAAGLMLLLTAMLLPVAAEQTALDRTLESQLKRVFPSATSFSPKQPSP